MCQREGGTQGGKIETMRGDACSVFLLLEMGRRRRKEKERAPVTKWREKGEGVKMEPKASVRVRDCQESGGERERKNERKRETEGR